MRFLFLTDFHGNQTAYENAFKAAETESCAAIVNAGDALPKAFGAGQAFAAGQKKWWDTWFLPKLHRLKEKGIRFYMMFGNDDAQGIVTVLDEAEDRGLLVRIDRPDWIPFWDHRIVGVPWVPDYPFGLKDWCCGDTARDQVCETQFGPAVRTDATHFRRLDRAWADEIRAVPSLKERLAAIPVPQDPRRAILFMHSPPAHGGLDVCGDGRRVGTKAGLEHLVERQYGLAMHGHIHESPQVSGAWHARVGDTLCVQPGAMPPTHTLVDLESKIIVHPYHGRVSF